MKCPICGEENQNEAFKEWQYGEYNVFRYKCSRCGEKFNHYIGEKNAYTIPKGQ